MIEDLLPYYEKQLQEFAQQSREFAQKYPKIAQRLSLNQEQIEDPHIERLIQAFSLISARIDKKLADSYSVFTRSLFEVMFPQYLRHFPACTVVSFEDIDKQKKLIQAHVIERKTTLKSKSFKGVQCEFNTCYEVKLLPIELVSLEFKTNPHSQLNFKSNAMLSFKFDIFNDAHTWLQKEQLPIYLDAISHFPLQVLDCIFNSNTTFSINVDNQYIDIKNPFETIGFSESESLLPIDQHTHHSYRLLMEYFCFSEKFNYLNLNLSFLNLLKKGSCSFNLVVHFKLNLNDQVTIRNYSELSVANFKLFTTPIVNLFEKQAEPQKIDHKQIEYPLISDAHHPELFKVYSILEMNVVREKSDKKQAYFPVLPFFSLSHYFGEKTQFFYSLNHIQYKSRYVEMGYSLISKKLEPHQIKSDFISTRLLCSNRELPHEALKQSNNALTLTDSNLARRAYVLKQPNTPYVFEQTNKEQWRLISLLSLNTLSLMEGDVVSHLKELLELYNLPKSKENHLIINAIDAVEFSIVHKMVNSKPFPVFVRGIKATVFIDIKVFRGHSLYIFSKLLSHVFNLKVQLNSFVDVHVFDSNTKQELYQCIQNAGGKKLL